MQVQIVRHNRRTQNTNCLLYTSGRYFAVLTLYNAEQVVTRQPLFLFRIERKQLAAFEAVPFTVELASVASHPQADRQVLLQQAQEFDNGRASLEQALSLIHI